MKFMYTVELERGYRKPMELEETKEVSIVIEADCRAEADRAFKALISVNNIIEYDGICIED